jgi:hypothetical protein
MESESGVYSWKVAEGEDAQQRGLAACSVAYYDEFPVGQMSEMHLPEDICSKYLRMTELSCCAIATVALSCCLLYDSHKAPVAGQICLDVPMSS